MPRVTRDEMWAEPDKDEPDKGKAGAPTASLGTRGLPGFVGLGRPAWQRRWGEMGAVPLNGTPSPQNNFRGSEGALRAKGG